MPYLVSGHTKFNALSAARACAARIHARTGVIVSIEEIKMYPITTQKELRRLFWEEHPDLARTKVEGDYKTDTRVAWCDFIEHMARSGQISEALAQRATL